MALMAVCCQHGRVSCCRISAAAPGLATARSPRKPEKSIQTWRPDLPLGIDWLAFGINGALDHRGFLMRILQVGRKFSEGLLARRPILRVHAWKTQARQLGRIVRIIDDQGAIRLIPSANSWCMPRSLEGCFLMVILFVKYAEE